MDAMLTIINNINKLLNVSLILPNIYDTNLIIEGMNRLKPTKNKFIAYLFNTFSPVFI